MTKLGVLLVLMAGATLASTLSLAPLPQECLLYPCAPPPPFLDIRCEDQCRENRDCGPNGLCCPGCGCRVCQLGAPIDSCRNKVCPRGEVCVDTPVVCKKPPCPQARCVPISTKPGRCPQFLCPIPLNPTCPHSCKTDNDCKGNHKCCTDCTGCQTCLPPANVCSTMRCPAGQVCVDKPPINCIRPPCPQARCVPISTKPGSCPQYRCMEPLNPTCSDKCKTDDDCRGDTKCCKDCTGCRNCHPPVGISVNDCDNFECPNGRKCLPFPARCACNDRLANCFVAPCQFSKCDNHPNAKCSDDYCGGCNAIWRENGRIITDCRRNSYPSLPSLPAV